MQYYEVKPLGKPPESVEHYLETILMLGYNGNPVRSVDIANDTGFSKPSISVAMKNLKARGYIVVGEQGRITLTESGREIAQKIYDRHALISDWLIFLGVDKDTAVQDACKVEHYLSDESFAAIQKHINSLPNSLPRASAP